MNDYRVRSAVATGAGYTIVENASLLNRNTFRVPARAGLLVEVRNTDALGELFGYPSLRTQPILVLGEGSNILFTRDWPGVVLSIATRGIDILSMDAIGARVRVAAGESWNDFVLWSLGNGFSGLENLVLIPGTVGAAPIQNIGAYGVEVREFVATVEAWDRREARLVRIDNADCAFGYRDSRFKREPDRYVVTAVEFALPRERPLQTGYAGVAEELAALGASTLTPSIVAEAITRIRTRKLPNPAQVGNAGSFFKNPVVDSAALARLRAAHPSLPAWEIDARHCKLSAAWLIEACGLKGIQEGDAAVSKQHALVLVNRGSATGAQIATLAERIRSEVRSRFDVEIEPEPLIA